MKKITKLLSVFLIAGVVGTGTAGIVGCKKGNDNPPPHEHSATGWEHDEIQHWQICPDDDVEFRRENHADTDGNDKCDVCGADMPHVASGFVVEANTSGLMVEGVTTEYNLSATLTSATVDIAQMKVYLDNQGTKGKEVPAANYTAELYDGTTKLDNWSGLKKDGTYTLRVTIKDATKPDGSASTAKKQVTIRVNNAYTAIALKSGTTEFVQGSTASTTDWVIEATRANGDTETVTPDSIASIDTVSAGTQQIAVAFGTLNINVPVTITADASLVTQSYALNVSSMANESINADKVIDTASGISVVANASKLVTIEGNNKTSGTKTFTKRLKLAGDANAVVIPNVNAPVAGATANTTVKTKVTIYAISGNSTNSRFISFTKDEATTPDVAQAVLLPGDAVTKCEFMLTEPGTYKFATFKADKFSGHPDQASAGSNGGINLYYIQVDKIISNAPAGVDNIPLGGQKAYVSLELDTTAVKTVYKKGDSIDTTGLVATAIASNSVTAESESEQVDVSNLTVTGYDPNVLGNQTVTVTYTPATGSAISATYSVTVESEIAGVTGIKASENLATKQVDTADGTIALTKENIVVALVGTNPDPAAVISDYTVKVDGVELTGSVNLTVKTYTIEVTATVTAGQAQAILTDTFEITISVKADVGSLENVVVDSTIVGTLTSPLTSETDLVNNANGRIFVTAGATADGHDVVVDTNNKTNSDGKKYTHRIKLGGTGKVEYRTIGIEVKAGATIVLYAMSSSGSAARDMVLLDSQGNNATATGTLDGAALGQLNGASLHKVTYTVTEAGTYYFGSVTGGINVYGIEIQYPAA